MLNSLVLKYSGFGSLFDFAFPPNLFKTKAKSIWSVFIWSYLTRIILILYKPSTHQPKLVLTHLHPLYFHAEKSLTRCFWIDSPIYWKLHKWTCLIGAFDFFKRNVVIFTLLVQHPVSSNHTHRGKDKMDYDNENVIVLFGYFHGVILLNWGCGGHLLESS